MVWTLLENSAGHEEHQRLIVALQGFDQKRADEFLQMGSFERLAQLTDTPIVLVLSASSITFDKLVPEAKRKTPDEERFRQLWAASRLERFKNYLADGRQFPRAVMQSLASVVAFSGWTWVVGPVAIWWTWKVPATVLQYLLPWIRRVDRWFSKALEDRMLDATNALKTLQTSEASLNHAAIASAYAALLFSYGENPFGLDFILRKRNQIYGAIGAGTPVPVVHAYLDFLEVVGDLFSQKRLGTALWEADTAKQIEWARSYCLRHTHEIFAWAKHTGRTDIELRAERLVSKMQTDFGMTVVPAKSLAARLGEILWGEVVAAKPEVKTKNKDALAPANSCNGKAHRSLRILRLPNDEVIRFSMSSDRCFLEFALPWPEIRNVEEMNLADLDSGRLSAAIGDGIWISTDLAPEHFFFLSWASYESLQPGEGVTFYMWVDPWKIHRRPFATVDSATPPPALAEAKTLAKKSRSDWGSNCVHQVGILIGRLW